MQPAATTTPGEVDTLLEQVLERPEVEWPAALEALCASRPQAAMSLRRRFALLAESGLVGAVPRPEFLSPGQRFAGYQLLELLGAGGMGVVFRARKEGGAGDVALKVLRPELLEHPTARSRFLREAASLADLVHPAVCGLVDFGEHAGVPFLAMKLLRGRTLAAAVAEARRLAQPGLVVGEGAERPAWRAVVRLFATLAHGLAAVHARGLVHRDVKPENIVVEREAPVLIDFGLAATADATRLTRSGEPLGTPAYMAPEQVRCGGVDARTDVYGLAASLYECVALRPPFLIAAREALYRAILNDDAPDVRVANPELPRSLALVLGKALQKEPSARYASASAFAEELERVAGGRSVQARPVPGWRRAWRWTKAHPRAAMTAAAVALVLGIGVVWLQLAERSARIESEGLAASSAALLSRDVTVGALVAREAWRNLPDSETTRSNLLLALSRNLQTGEFEIGEPTTGYLPSPDGEVALLLSHQIWLRDGARVRAVADTALTGSLSKTYNSAAWAADGQSCLVASYGSSAAKAVSRGKLVRLSRQGQRLPLDDAEFPGTPYLGPGGVGPAHVVAARSDGSFVVGDNIGGLRVIDPGGRTVAAWQASAAGATVAFVGVLANGTTIVTVDGRGEVCRWDRLVDPPNVLRAPQQDVSAVCRSGDGRFLAIGDCAGDVHVVDVEAGTVAFTVGFGVSKPIETLALSADGSTLFASARGQRWALWRTGGEPVLQEKHREFRLVRAASFSPSGDRLAYVDLGGRLTVLDRDGREIVRVAAHGAATVVVRFTSEHTFVTGGYDPVVREWRIEPPGLMSLRVHEYPALSVAWLPDGRSVVSSDADGTVAWTRIDGTRIDSYRHPGPGQFLFALALSPDGQQVVVGSSRRSRVHRLRLDTAAARLVKLEPEFGDRPWSSAAWLDPTTVVLGAVGGSVTAYDVTTGKQIREWRLPDGSAAHSWQAFVAVGRHGGLATSSNDATVRLWRLDGTLERTLFEDNAPIDAVDMAADGSVLVGLKSGWLGLLDSQGRTVRRFEGGLSNVCDVLLSPDGRFVATASQDGMLQVWSSDGASWLRIPQPALPYALAFSPDSEQLAVACSDGAIHIWPVTEERIRALAGTIFRDLTLDERRTILGR